MSSYINGNELKPIPPDDFGAWKVAVNLCPDQGVATLPIYTSISTTIAININTNNITEKDLNITINSSIDTNTDVETETDANITNNTKADVKTGPDADVRTNSDPDYVKTNCDAGADVKTNSYAGADVETDFDSNLDVKPGFDANVIPGSDAALKADSHTNADVKSNSNTDGDIMSDSDTDIKVDIFTDSTNNAATDTAAEDNPTCNVSWGTLVDPLPHSPVRITCALAPHHTIHERSPGSDNDIPNTTCATFDTTNNNMVTDSVGSTQNLKKRKFNGDTSGYLEKKRQKAVGDQDTPATPALAHFASTHNIRTAHHPTEPYQTPPP
ncbi:hypothetical protein HK104_010173 [Borealophlyctis nickersoniae]|nr:hypothetical protein HK104_010173 [Borealophlyctis nickersoniae]